jgi:hypothetical protein
MPSMPHPAAGLVVVAKLTMETRLFALLFEVATVKGANAPVNARLLLFYYCPTPATVEPR